MNPVDTASFPLLKEHERHVHSEDLEEDPDRDASMTSDPRVGPQPLWPPPLTEAQQALASGEANTNPADSAGTQSSEPQNSTDAVRSIHLQLAALASTVDKLPSIQDIYTLSTRQMQADRQTEKQRLELRTQSMLLFATIGLFVVVCLVLLYIFWRLRVWREQLTREITMHISRDMEEWKSSVLVELEKRSLALPAIPEESDLLEDGGESQASYQIGEDQALSSALYHTASPPLVPHLGAAEVEAEVANTNPKETDRGAEPLPTTQLTRDACNVSNSEVPASAAPREASGPTSDTLMEPVDTLSAYRSKVPASTWNSRTGGRLSAGRISSVSQVVPGYRNRAARHALAVPRQDGMHRNNMETGTKMDIQRTPLGNTNPVATTLGSVFGSLFLDRAEPVANTA